MAKALLSGIVLATLVAAVPASAHHEASALGIVTLTQPVLAGGTRLDPGTYQIRLTGKHMEPLPGQSENAGQEVEFVSKGIIVARDFAEVMAAAEAPVGTSGGRASQPRVDRLRGNEFVRVSVHRDDERFLIHLAVAQIAGSR